MSYSLITVWEVYQNDTGNMYYEKHIGYYTTKEMAKKAAEGRYDVQTKEAIKVGEDIFLLANGVGYNKPIKT